MHTARARARFARYPDLGSRAARAGAALVLASASLVVGAPTTAGAASPTCGSAGTPNVTALADPTFYVDTGASPALLANYAGYTVRPSSALSDGYVRLSGFTGGSIALAGTQAAALPLGQLAANQATTQYFLLQAAGVTTTAQTHTISVFQGDPALGGTELCSRTFTYNRVADTIKAQANKVTSVAASTTSANVGESVTVTVNGTTGTLGAGPAYDPGVLAYTPAVYSSFPADAWKLTRTQLTISPDGVKPAQTYVDRLALNGASGPDRPYTAVYTFLALAPTPAPVSITPVQQIASGTQVKHTDLGGLAATFPSVVSTATLTVAKSASVSSQLGGGRVDYTVTISNTGGIGRIDRLVDALPAGATFVAGAARLDGTTIPDPSISGQTLVFPGPITVPAASGPTPGTRTYTYGVTLAGTVGWHANSAYGTVGGSQIDTTASLLDDAKATASVFVDANPTAVNDTASTPQGVARDVTVLTNDTLAPMGTSGSDPRVKSVTSVGTPSHGTVSINGNGTLHYTPTAGYTGSDTFGYTMTDGRGGTASATVTMLMGPRAANDSYTLVAATSTTSNLAVLANDGCPSCTVAVDSSSTTIANLSVSSDQVVYTTKSTATIVAGTTTDTFTYTISDPATGYTSQATVTIAFSKAQRDNTTTAVNTPVTISTATNDTCKSTGQKCALTFGGLTTGTSANGGSLTVTNANTASPTVTYTPPSATWSGVDTWSYTVDVGTGANSQNQVVTGNTVLVGPGNQTSTVQPNTTTSAPVVSSAFSTSCVGCTYVLEGTTVSKGVLTLATDGTYTYTPNANTTGTDAFGFRVTEPGTGLSRTATHTITIVPVANADTAQTRTSTAVTVAVLTNDVCTSCTVAVTGAPAHGTTSVTGNQVTYTPTAGYVGGDSLTYRITDAAGSQATATVTLTVVGTPPAPTPVGDSLTTPFNTDGTIDVSPNDTQLQSGATYAIATDPSHGTVSITSAGVATYHPTSGFSGSDSFTYRVCQPAPYSAQCGTATVSVLVRPDAVADTAQGTAGQPLSGTVAANDTFPTSSTFATAGDPTHGTVTVHGDGTFTYTPDGGYSGPDSFSYTLCLPAPNGSTCATATVTVMVGPAATADTASTTAGTPVAIDVLANDGCSTCTPEVLTDAAHGTVSLNADGSLLYSPFAGFTGTDTFTYLVTDESGGTASAAVTVTISPTAADDAAATPTSTPVDIAYRANDACTACTVSFGTPTQGTVSANGDGTAHYVPPAAWTGTATFTYTLTDPATSLTASATVTVVVNDAGPDAGTTPYGTQLALPTSVLANDACSGCAVTGHSTPAHGSATVAPNGTTTYTPDAGFFGRDAFTYTAGNGSVTVTGTVTVLVLPPTRDVAVIAETATPGATLTGITCDACSTAPLTPPVHGSVELAADGTFTYTPDAGFTGTDSFTYLLTDAATGLSGPGTVHLTVSGPDAPVAVDDAVVTPFGTTVHGDTRANDHGSGTLTSTLLAGPAQGTASVSVDGSFEYVPDASYAGDDSFTYTLADAYGQSDTATVRVSVARPDPPDAVDDSASTAYNTPLTGTTRTNDTGTGTLTTTRLASPAHGSLTVAADGGFTYTPSSGFAGTDSFTYVLADAYDQSDTATVEITVAPPSAPVATDDAFTTPFETARTGTTRTNDTGTGTLTTSLVADVDHGTLALAGDGTFTYTPTSGFAGVDGFTYTVADSFGQSSGTAVVTITVGLPDPPVAHDDAFGTPLDTPRTATTRTNDSGTGTLTTTLVDDVAHGTLTLHGDGTFTYTPASGFAGTDSFTYVLGDTYGQTSELATVTVSIGKPDGPIAVDDTFATGFESGVDGDVTTNDSGTGALIWTLATDVAHGTLTLNDDGSFSYDPAPGFAGEDTFTYTVSDTYGQTSDSATVTITVAAPAAPVAQDDSADVAFDTTYDGTTRANDTGTGALTSARITSAAHGTATVAGDGAFSYTPDAGFVGTDSFRYSLADTYGQSATATVTLQVAAPAAPDAVDDEATTPFATTLNGTTRPNDTGSGTLVSALHTDAAHGNATVVDDGTYTYVPDPGYAGDDGFTYDLTDPYGGTDQATVTIHVGLPDAPVAGDDDFSIGHGSSLVQTTRANDSGTGTLTTTLVDDVTDGTLSLAADGTFSYQPDQSFSGTDTFTYTVTDAYAQTSDVATVTIEVAPAPATATITGVVWLDANHDGHRDAGEPALPGVDVSAATGGSTVAQTTTAADGSYELAGLAEDTYDVSAPPTTVGLAAGWDADGGTDAVATVDATSGTAQADFAEVGIGTLTGLVRTETGTPIPHAQVTCTWAGLDGTMPSSDDVVFTTEADGQGAFTLTGVPFGELACRGVEPGTDTSATVRVLVADSTPTSTEIVLPVSVVTVTDPASPPTTTTVPAEGASPTAFAFTGFGGLALPAAGAAAMLAGLGLAWATRRRDEELEGPETR